MSFVARRIGGVETITDLAPVEELLPLVEEKFTLQELDLIRDMGAEQLRFALIEMVGKYRGAHGVLRHMHTEAGQRAVTELRKMKAAAKEAGVSLWDDWPELTV